MATARLFPSLPAVFASVRLRYRLYCECNEIKLGKCLESIMSHISGKWCFCYSSLCHHGYPHHLVLTLGCSVAQHIFTAPCLLSLCLPRASSLSLSILHFLCRGTVLFYLALRGWGSWSSFLDLFFFYTTYSPLCYYPHPDVVIHVSMLPKPASLA